MIYMNLFIGDIMKFIFFLSLLLGAQSFATTTETFFYDDQKELKEAFERAQAAHSLKEMSSTFSRPTMIEKEKVIEKRIKQFEEEK